MQTQLQWFSSETKEIQIRMNKSICDSMSHWMKIIMGDDKDDDI